MQRQEAQLQILPEDVPALEPLFDFTLLARALKELVAQERRSAFVLGIHGPWGSGKTTLLNSLDREIGQLAGVAIVEFNAWKYQEREALWRALILRVLGAVRQHGGDEKALGELERSLYRSFVEKEHGPLKIDWQSVFTEAVLVLLRLFNLDMFGGVLKKTVGWVRDLLGGEKAGDGQGSEELERIGKVLQRETVERNIDRVASIEQFLGKFQDLMAGLQAHGKRVFVFIDDLDRCLPDSALEVFEAIKLFLDAAGCTYVVAVDREVIRRGLILRYKESDAGAIVDPDEYIEKTISLSFDLPILAPSDIESIIEGYKLPVALTPEQRVRIAAGLGANPRRIKRFMNILSLQLYIAAQTIDAGRPSAASPLESKNVDLFLKLSLIGYRHSGLFMSMLREPALAIRLQNAAAAYKDSIDKGKPSDAQKRLGDNLRDESAAISATSQDRILWRILSDPPSLSLDKAATTAMLGWFRPQ